MTGTLVVTSLTTGTELDRVTLDAGTLTYATGRARGLFESLRASRPGLSDEDLFRLRTDWSNGYLAITATGA
jgi:hypothetical protein